MEIRGVLCQFSANSVGFFLCPRVCGVRVPKIPAKEGVWRGRRALECCGRFVSVLLSLHFAHRNPKLGFLILDDGFVAPSCCWVLLKDGILGIGALLSFLGPSCTGHW